MPPFITRSGLGFPPGYESATGFAASSSVLPTFVLYVPATSGVTVTTVSGESVNIPTVPAGTVLPLLLTAVTAASTAYLIALR